MGVLMAGQSWCGFGSAKERIRMDADMLGTVGGMGVLASLWVGMGVALAGMTRLSVMWGGNAVLPICTVGLVVGAVSFLALLFGVQAAEASYESVGVCAAHGSGEGELGESALGVAVNEKSGEIYVSDGFNARVTRFGARGDFLGAWGWGVVASGPDKVGDGFEDCIHANKDVCTQGRAGEGEGQFGLPQRVAVDQTTGDVYVLDRERNTGVVQVFSADGEHLVSSFGEISGATLSEGSLEKIRKPLSIAVDSSGNVYVGDSGVNPLEGRVMVFQPKAGSEYKEYKYTGELARGHVPSQVGIDALGDVFVGTEEVVYKFTLGDPSVPTCESDKYVRLDGMTVDPGTGEVFIYGDARMMLYRLSSSCEQIEEFSGVAGEKKTSGLAFNPNPVLVWGSCVKQVGGRFVDGPSLLGSSSDPNGCSEEGVGGGFELVDERLPGVLYGVNPGNPEVLHWGLIFAPAVVRAPVVVGVGVSGVGSGSVTFGARIDTRGFVTHYKFLYYSDAVGSVCSVVRECE